MNKIKAGILIASSIMMSATALSPILAEVARAFPTTPVTTVQMIVVLPGLTSIPFSLLAGRLTTHFTKKHIALFAMLVMMAGGLIPLLFHASIAPLLLASGILSIGQGLMIPVSASLISDYFEGDERGVLMGWQSTFVNGGGMIMVILSGLLAKIAWPDAYLLFLLFIPAITGLAVLLPPGRIMAQPGGRGLGLNRSIAYLSGTALIFSLLYTTYSTNIAMYLDSTRLGDATSAGLATSLLTGAGIASGLLFGRLFRFLKGFTLPLTVGLATAGLLLTYFGDSLPMVFAGGLVCGFGFSTLMPLGILLAIQSVAPERSAFAIAVFTGSVGIGSFISPLLVNGLANLAGHSDVKTRFLIAATGLFVLLVITLARELRARPRLAPLPEER